MLLVWTGVWRLRLPLRRIILQQGWIRPKISQSKNIVFKVLFYLISKGIVDQYFFKWANPGSSFIYFRVFNTVNIFFADDWIRTADLWRQKQLLYQLSHNHCHFVEQNQPTYVRSANPLECHFQL